jgi:hypothetical protein
MGSGLERKGSTFKGNVVHKRSTCEPSWMDYTEHLEGSKRASGTQRIIVYCLYIIVKNKDAPPTQSSGMGVWLGVDRG